MVEKLRLSRRSLLATSAVSVALAGCSGSGDESKPTETTNTTDEQEQTVTTEESAPTLEEFEYPEGASQDGLDVEALYSTHVSTLTESGSLTFNLDTTINDGDFEFTIDETNKLNGGNTWQTVDNDGQTKTTWSPAGEQLGYVKVESGFETGYRIENEAPSTNQVAGLNRVENALLSAEWGEASEVIETDDGYAAVYKSVGVGQSSIRSVDEVNSFEATATVSEEGFVRNMTETLEGISDNEPLSRDGEISITAVGETTVEEPDWVDTAREDGLQITMEQAGGQTAFRLEMMNGSDLSSDTRVSLRDEQGRGSGEIGGGLTVGDQLYLGLSPSDELLVSKDGVPDGARQLTGRTRVAIYSGDLTLFERSVRL